jgi:hypothetical protein
MKVYKITGTTATRAEVLLKDRRRRIEGKSFKIQRVAPKKKAATRATCKPEMERISAQKLDEEHAAG